MKMTAFFNDLLKLFRKPTENISIPAESHLTSLDLLTLLPNRYLLEELLNKSLLRTKKNKKMLALFYINLDNFKHVNDYYGYASGDIVLQQMGQRLQLCVRPEDVIGRLNGDEFCIILEDIENMAAIILLAQKIIDSFKTPFLVNEKEILITASIGIANYSENENYNVNIMQHANNALYRAKNAGRNCYKFYSKTQPAKLERYMLIVKHLRGAIEANELELFYQPQMDAQSSQFIGMEALLRWTNPALNNPQPAEFIPIAEEIGLINEIGAWVVTEALHQYDLWFQQYKALENVRISINISAKQLGDNLIMPTVINILKKTKIPTKNILFELTETAMMKETLNTKSLIHTFLMELGIGLSIDDFGTGYSSMTYLKQLPIRELKIDKSFIDDIGTKNNSESIIKAIIMLARALDLEVVAEGVETTQQLEFLRANHCQIIQGYCFSKPLSKSDMTKYISHLQIF